MGSVFVVRLQRWTRVRLILVEAEVSRLEERLSHLEAELADVRTQRANIPVDPVYTSLSWGATRRLTPATHCTALAFSKKSGDGREHRAQII
jgi:hypothetical protein